MADDIDYQGFRNDIRIIAKTKELEDAANKALKVSQEVKKEAINISRNIAGQVGVASKDSTANANNGSGDGDEVIGADGNSFIAPLAPPPNPPTSDPANSPVQNNPSSSYDQYLDSNGVWTQKGSGTNASNTAGGTTSSQGVGGSQTKDQATAGESNTDWQNIKAAMIAAGKTDAEINQARAEFLLKENGVFEISDVVDGTAGPKPASPISGTSLITGYYELSEVLNAVVGVDPDNEDLAVQVRFDGKEVPPSDEDSPDFHWINEEGHNGQPDPTFQVGIRWADGSGDPVYMSPNIWFNTNPIVLALKELYSDLVLEPFSSLQWHAFTLDGGGVAATVFGSECNIDVDEMCPSVAPTEYAPPSWPETGTYLLKFIDGIFVGSLKDSEVPDKFRNPTSNIQVKSLVSGETYNIEPAANGGFMLSQAVDPPYYLLFGADRSLQSIVVPEAHNFWKPRTGSLLK